MTTVPNTDAFATAPVPPPLDGESYRLLRTDTYDDSNVSVFVNERDDFAFLSSQSDIDYSSCESRSQKLGPKNSIKSMQARYESKACQAFYLRSQHAYVYAGGSLSRGLEHSGFCVTDVIPYQRYGLENHLQWPTVGKPGGNECFRGIGEASDGAHRRALGDVDATDTVIVRAVLS